MTRFITLLMTLLLAVSLGTARAETSQPYVGKILGIKGGEHGRRAWITTADGKRTSAVLRPGDRICVGDIIEAGDGTTIAIEFVIGGQSVTNQNTSTEIISRHQTREVGNQFLVKSRALWAKIDKQKETLQIQTAGGVIAVEG